jgi:outer membrane immunogenic protein
MAFAPVTPTLAADRYNWGGFYLGGHAGYGWGEADVSVLRSPVETTTVTIQAPAQCRRPNGRLFPTVVPTAEELAALNSNIILPSLAEKLGLVPNGGGFDQPSPPRFVIVSDVRCASPAFILADPDGTIRFLDAAVGEIVPGAITSTTATTVVGPFAGVPLDAAATSFVAALPGENLSLDSFDGFVGGVQVGYNHQVDAFVFGLEADFSSTDYSASETFGGVLGVELEMDWVASARARFGYAFDRLLVYGTGGMAFGQAELAYRLGAVEITEDETHTGFIIGAGAEYALTDRLSVKAEYAFTEFGEETYFEDAAFDSELDIESQRIVLGVSFHF